MLKVKTISLEPGNFDEEKKFTSLYLVEEINKFRALEGNRAELKHFNFLIKIEAEFEEEIQDLKIQALQYTYSTANGGTKQAKMYELDFEQSVQILMIESEFEEEINALKIQAVTYDFVKENKDFFGIYRKSNGGRT